MGARNVDGQAIIVHIRNHPRFVISNNSLKPFFPPSFVLVPGDALNEPSPKGPQRAYILPSPLSERDIPLY